MSQFTESDIRASANGQSYDRGYGYYYNGNVSGVVRRGNLITAQVAGSDYQPYDVAVTLLEDGSIGSTTCTCPYDWGGYCKHVVAVLLTVLHEAEGITVKPELETLLAGLTDTQLRRIIRNVAQDQPVFAAAVEQEIKWLKMEPASGLAPVPPPAAHSIVVDVAAIRREMHKDFRAIASSGGGYSDRYWDDDASQFDPNEVLGPHLGTAAALLDAGDVMAATTVITAVIEEWGSGVTDLEEWVYEANEDVIDEAAETLGAILAEALLSQDLSPELREQWLARIEDWAEDVISMEIAETAVAQWWDYPPLVAALQGNITEQGAWEGEAPSFADELTLVRLRILQRQGRTQEYINLAEAEGQLSLYVNMLARTGQVEKAVAEAKQFISLPSEILSLAQVLVEQGQRAAALMIAAHGLELTEQGSKTQLARWTLALAQQAEDTALALHAAQMAFLSSYELADYKVVERLAGSEWPAIKSALLERMEQAISYHKLDIYLYEHMHTQAMAYVDRLGYGADLERVVQATRAEFPDWGIQKCKIQAERIMDAGKANAYDTAVAWLRTARDIYLQHSRQAEWQSYLASLLELHARKYKLVPMLRAIR